MYRQRLVDLQEVVDVFCAKARRYATRRGQHYIWQYSQYGEIESTEYASVLEIDSFTVTLHSTLPIPLPPTAPSTDFWDV